MAKKLNHKWITEPSNGLYHKSQNCDRCGVRRQWLGGVWQQWEYWLGAGVVTFSRPNCDGKKK